MFEVVLAAAVLAQAPASPALQERTVTVTVVDDKGNPVEGLAVEEVAVQEAGVARPLARLEADRRPLRVAVLVDSSQPMASEYRLHMVDAVLKFLLRLPEGAQYAIWTTGDRPTRIYGLGSDRAAAAQALRRVIPQGGNVLFDAIVEAARELGEKEDGRSAIVAVTGLGVGFANYHRDQVVDEATKSGAVLLAVTVEEGREASSGFSTGDRLGAMDYEFVLSRSAERTGGRRESVLSPMGLDDALLRLAGDLRGRYRLTYQGAPGDKPKIEVTVARPGAKARVAPVAR